MTMLEVKDRPPVSKLGPKVSALPIEFDFDVESLPEGACTPFMDLCVVAPLKAKEKTKGGIILADITTEVKDYVAQFGRIESVGEFFYKLPPFNAAVEPPKVGDYIQFTPYSARRFEVDGMVFYLAKAVDIIQRIDPTRNIRVFT